MNNLGTTPKRDARGRWIKGVSGNDLGRPRSAFQPPPDALALIAEGADFIGGGQGLSNSLYRLVYSRTTPAVSTYGAGNFSVLRHFDELRLEMRGWLAVFDAKLFDQLLIAA